ncbi:HNH endonuclease [Arthrobacter phage Kitkat]|uniref:HNH endonuclease n=2 Tax=Kelleziovirus kitkat TaxID=1982238 RepID=A0A140G6R3_9CAUD|nr:endonuclease [Arthrobacter phage Kitkat]AMM44348.1 HNH endonuclease [Arthrobacter phage Kitkat]QGJ96525.1 HNH endonuclease [Arthrobacter phage BeatusComedenti]
MAARTVPEQCMAHLLEGAGIPYSEQEKVGGHKIDFVAHFPSRDLLIDVNGDRWHHWMKIVDCDRIKLDRVIATHNRPFAVWWSRLQKDPAAVLAAILHMGFGEQDPDFLPWWDWAVDVDSLTPENATWIRDLLAAGKTLTY